jgi:type VI secretion system secreted protein Hcp
VALSAYLKLAGARTGAVQGSVTQKGREGKIAVNAVSHEILSPRDPATGLPSGKRQHQALTITKELDRATVPLRSILVNNDDCKEWELQFWRPSPTGAETQYFTIRLTHASIASIDMQMPNNTRPELMKLETFEDVTFVYQKIEWSWTDGGLLAADDWMAPIA